MTYPLIQFVDGPSATAVLRYDFNTKNSSYRTHPLGADGLDLGVPSFSGEPGGVGVDYGYRQIRLTQRIEGSKAQAMDRLSALSRELLRDDNWLRLQLDATSPVRYFRTYRTEPGSLSLEHIETAGAWDVQVPLVAEGFAYGPRETIPQVQIVQSPADLTGPTRYAMRYVLPAIKGDAPTGLRVTVTPGSTLNSGLDCKWMVGCISGETSMSDPVVDIGTGDGFTAGTGTSAPVADAAYFNGSYRTVTVAAGAGNMLDRLTGPFPVVSPGRYKVMLRYEMDVGAPGPSVAKSFIFQMVPSIAGFGVVPPTTTPVGQIGNGATGQTGQGWVDLGDFTLPFGVGAAADVTGTVPAPTFVLRIGTPDAGSGTVRIDAFKLIPVDGPTVASAELLTARFSKSPLRKLVVGTFDADTESYWSMSSGAVFYEGTPALAGGFPLADPAAPRNLLLLMATDRGSSAGTTPWITAQDAQSAVDVSYHPRYLYVGDGT